MMLHTLFDDLDFLANLGSAFDFILMGNVGTINDNPVSNPFYSSSKTMKKIASSKSLHNFMNEPFNQIQEFQKIHNEYQKTHQHCKFRNNGVAW